MGVPFKDLVVREPISIEDLRGKKLAVDAYNILYQFLSAIRQRDGTPLTDKNGNITSHLSGLFYRTLKLLQVGAQPCFVFDGEAPELKSETQESRAKIKIAATEKHKIALASGDLESARKYGQQTSRLTHEMVVEAKELIEAMGLPHVQAVGDAEAQAAYMVQQGHAWAVVSQDYDALLFGANKVVRNLTVSQKKTKTRLISSELLTLADILNVLKMDLPKLVNVAILVGTDYNTGIKGVGPKTAVKIIQENRFSEYKEKIPRLDAVRNIFLKPAITSNYSLEWKPMNFQKIREILCERHGFKEDRINSALSPKKMKIDKNQSSLGDF